MIFAAGTGAAFFFAFSAAAQEASRWTVRPEPADLYPQLRRQPFQPEKTPLASLPYLGAAPTSSAASPSLPFRTGKGGIIIPLRSGVGIGIRRKSFGLHLGAHF